MPSYIQIHLEQLSQSLGDELRRRDEEKLLLVEEREKIYQRALEVNQFLEALQQQKDLVDSELVHVGIKLKQAVERVDQLEEQVAGESARLANLREALQAEARLSSQLTLENVDLKLALEAVRLNGSAESSKEKELPHLNLPAEIEEENRLPDLHTLAYEDLVTGLPNFRSGLRRLTDELERAVQGQVTVAVVVMDVERLRELNLYLGHSMTNQVLQLLLPRVTPLLRKGDQFVRGRDDEFWLILPSPNRGPLGLKTASEYASELLKKIYEELLTPLELEDQRVTLGLSSGIACSQGEEAAEAVVDRALLAVAAAKKTGRNRACHYMLEMEKPVRTRLAMIPQLRQALHRGQFELRFQPIWELANRQMRAVESLLRWEHPLNGLSEPATFLEAACESGLIVAIGEWVVLNVCYLSKSYRHLHWTLNVSAQELLQADFVERLGKAIESAKLSKGDRLILEVGEAHLVHDSQRLLEALKGLRQWKVGLAVDDFSFDTLTLRRLHTLGAHYLKLGPQITQSVAEPLSQNLIKGAVLAAEGLGIKVIAEGIENQTQFDQLAQLGCHWGQGYFLGAPVSLADLEEKLKSRARL